MPPLRTAAVMLALARTSKVIGLDIGSSAIKLVELQSTKRGIELSRVGVAPMPQGAMVEGVIVDPSAVAAVIQEIDRKSTRLNSSHPP